MPHVTLNWRRRSIAIAAVGVGMVTVTAACAMALVGPTTAVPSASLQSAAPAPPVSATTASYSAVQLPAGQSFWQQSVPEGKPIIFAVSRDGDQVVTARVGMGGPRCFFGVVSDGALVGRYRVITAGTGLDQQAPPMRVAVDGDQLSMVERATGRDVGTYQRVAAGDPAEATGAQALATCADVRSAPATATPQ